MQALVQKVIDGMEQDTKKGEKYMWVGGSKLIDVSRTQKWQLLVVYTRIMMANNRSKWLPYGVPSKIAYSC